MDEREAEATVLSRVRETRSWLMRELSDRHPLHAQGRYAVLDVWCTDPKTPGYSKVLCQGATWVEVLEKMRRVGT